MEGDGSVSTNGTRSCDFYTANLADEIQALCAMHGYSASIYPYVGNSGTVQYRVNICERQMSQMDVCGKWQEIEYSGNVWCLQVPNENFLVRRNGRAFFTGNCWTRNFAGIDYVRTIFRELDIVYAKNRLRLVLKINGIEYRVLLRHQYRFKSSINLSNQFLRMWEMSDWEWDIGLVGHTHDGPFVFNFERGLVVNIRFRWRL